MASRAGIRRSWDLHHFWMLLVQHPSINLRAVPEMLTLLQAVLPVDILQMFCYNSFELHNLWA